MNSPRNIKLVLEYDGSAFHGWQLQTNARTVQGELEKALERVTGESIRVAGASRTDAGVHARGMVCNFLTNSRIPGDRFPHALNALMPGSISVLSAIDVSPDFHARFMAKGKTYVYRIANRPVRPALDRHQLYFVSASLDLDAMREAAARLQGTHDFASFQAAGSQVEDTFRTIFDLRVMQPRPGEINILVCGDGFLYNMVRIIAGTLLLVGRGKLPAERVDHILSSRDRAQAGPTAPAHGLCLLQVHYTEQGLNLDTIDTLL